MSKKTCMNCSSEDTHPCKGCGKPFCNKHGHGDYCVKCTESKGK